MVLLAAHRLRDRISDKPLYRRILRNAGWLFSTQALGGLIGIATIAMMARALGPAGLGTIAILLAYVRIVDRLTRLEPWQAVIRYGMDALKADDDERFRRLIKASLLTDIAGGLIAGTVALSLAGLAAPFLGLSSDDTGYVYVLSLGLFVSLSPTGIAVLRIFDRFDLLAKVDLGAVLLRFALTAIAFWMGLGLWAFVGIALVEIVLHGIIRFGFAFALLLRRGHGAFLRSRMSGVLSENPGVLRFLWNSNVNVILRQSTQRLDVLILSAMTDTVAVGTYYLARRLAEAALKFARPIGQVIYPELVRKWTAGDFRGFRSLVQTMTGSLALLSIIAFVPIALNMGGLLSTFFGAEFRDAALLVNVQLLAVAVYLSGIVANPAMLTVGRDAKLVNITLLATVLFFVLIVPLVHVAGAVGLAINHLLFNLIWLGSCAMVLRGAVDTALVERASRMDIADAREDPG